MASFNETRIDDIVSDHWMPGGWMSKLDVPFDFLKPVFTAGRPATTRFRGTGDEKTKKNCKTIQMPCFFEIDTNLLTSLAGSSVIG